MQQQTSTSIQDGTRVDADRYFNSHFFPALPSSIAPKLSKFGQPKAFELTPETIQLSGAELVEQLGLAPALVSGFPYLSPIAKLLTNAIESRIRGLAQSYGFLELELPTVAPLSILDKTGISERFHDEIVQLAAPRDALHLSSTTEEPLLAYLEGMEILSYRQLPLRFFHFNDVYRWIARAKGYFASREIHTCIMTQLSIDQTSLVEGVRHFSDLCSELWRDIGLSTKAVFSGNQDAVEHFYRGARSDRRLDKSVAVRKGSGDSEQVLGDNLWTSLCMAYPYAHMDKFSINVSAQDGSKTRPLMFTAGIGIQRSLIAALDECRDRLGLKMPCWLQPWRVAILPLGEGELSVSSDLGARLARAGIKVIVDDRLGRSLKSRMQCWDFWGTEIRVVIGEKEVKAGSCEIRQRGLESRNIVALDRLLDHLGGSE